MASSSSSVSHSRNYEVFLSFRGEDTRKTFVDHLYSALSQNGIHTYKDDETLPRGESIAPALFKAIEGSLIAVIIFSENYADSSWCLEELAHIMKCKDERGQIVIPIFYHVDPSDVGKQKRKFEEAFATHESEKKDRVEFWRKALSDAGSRSGWVPTDKANGYESKFIKGIVDDILSKLLPFDSNIDKELVGMRTRLQDLKSKLEIGSGDVRMVGIWGVGGGGKTTLASSLYSEISSKFDGCCFIENVREESGKSGLEKLQAKILSRVLKNNMEVERVDEGKGLIQRRLCQKNVLIVLDDVDHIDQLRALAGSHKWFGGGSRIIITTRDEHVLKANEVNEIYDISLLTDDEANQLFRKHALSVSNYITNEDYKTFSREVISYAGGLPLALKVLGSFLSDKNKDEWISALARLKDIPDDDIMEKLKISYDGLKPVEKELFLDIACIFRGWHKVNAMVILNACGFHAAIGVKVLVQKALITVDHESFDMHDLVEEMGHYIVRGEHPNNPEKHSRVWKEEDCEKICNVVATQENYTIEAFWFSTLIDNGPHGLPQAISNMKKLRWISCSNYPETCLPSTFQPMELCYLKMGYYGKIEKLWEGYKYLPSLKVLHLFGLDSLLEISDLSGLPCLEKLLVQECESLEEIHPSIGNHKGLVEVHIQDVPDLEMFPPIICMEKLESLILEGCEKLYEFPNIQMNMDRLKRLDMIGSVIEVIPTSIGEYCTNLESLDFSYSSNLKSIEANFHRLKHLKKLNLLLSDLKDGDLPANISDLSNLEELVLSRNNFSIIGSGLSQLPRLKFLNLSYCRRLVELPDLPSSIAILDASYCKSLETVGDFLLNYNWLWNVLFRGNDKLGWVSLAKVLESMLKGNAIEHYFMTLDVTGVGIPITCSFQSEIFRLPLQQNWVNDFTGFLIGFARSYQRDKIGGMCYISFGSLRHTIWWNSIERPSQISFSIEENVFAVELVRRRDTSERANDTTTDCSEFWDHEKICAIKHDSKSTLEIEWREHMLIKIISEDASNMWTQLRGGGNTCHPLISKIL